jgi:cytochrome oxidase Cu insertion factor (SCO1/SenC/PrrC family)
MALFALLSGLALVVGGALRVAQRTPAAPPVLGTVGAFDLLDQRGRRVTGADLQAGPWIADFIFTSCAGACPRMTARLARLRSDLPPGFRLVSFTVDPRTDTPDRLSAYATRVGAGPEWLFVTGPLESLHALATEHFHLAAMELPPGEATADGPFLHSQKFVLVDRGGRIRGYYDSDDEAALRDLLADVRAVQAE